MSQILWQFSVTTGQQVDHVSLVTENERGVSTWLDMSPQGRGRWVATRSLSLESGRVHYITQEGSTFLNCGTYGLCATRLDEHVNVAVSA